MMDSEQDVEVIALKKEDEMYFFFYHEGRESELLLLLGEYASNPELSFDWYDAARCSAMVRQYGRRGARSAQERGGRAHEAGGWGEED